MSKNENTYFEKKINKLLYVRINIRKKDCQVVKAVKMVIIDYEVRLVCSRKKITKFGDTLSKVNIRVDLIAKPAI